MPNIQEAQATYEVSPLFEGIFSQALRLPPLQKVRLVEQLMNVLERELMNNQDALKVMPSQQLLPRRSSFGALAHLGEAPSAEEIDDTRREAWANFPHEDIL